MARLILSFVSIENTEIETLSLIHLRITRNGLYILHEIFYQDIIILLDHLVYLTSLLSQSTSRTSIIYYPIHAIALF